MTPEEEAAQQQQGTGRNVEAGNWVEAPTANSSIANTGYDVNYAAGNSAHGAAQKGATAFQSAKEWAGNAVSDVGGWLKGAGKTLGNGISDVFSAETVSGPAQGQWAAPGTRADQYAGAAQQRGEQLSQQANQQGAHSLQAASGMQGEAQQAANRAAPTTDFGQADRWGKRAEWSGDNARQLTNNAGNASQQQAQLQALNNFANGPEGPSAAQAQLQAGSDAAQRSAMSMARSGRGAGDSAAALRDASFSNATTQGTVAGQAADLRARETSDYKQRQLAALNAAMGGSGAIRGADATAAQVAQGNRSQDLAQQQQAANQAQFGTQTQLTQQAQNDAARQGLYNSSLGFANNALGYSQMGQAGELGYAQLGQNAYNSQADYELAQQQMQLDAAKANQSADLEKDSGITGMISSGAGAIASLFSDERLKKDIKKERALSRALGGGGGGELETLGNAPAYSYKYKDPTMPGTRPGTQRSSMAQDLEKGPHGGAVVTNTPKGKMVNYEEVVKLTPGALTELNQRLRALESSLGRKSA